MGSTTIVDYLKRYKRKLLLSVFANILLSIFTVVSIPIVIPFFQILFDRKPNINASSGIERWLNEKFISIVNLYGKESSLIIVCVAIVLIFLCKNFFRYLALYFITPVRNGVVRDIRQNLFHKYIDLPISYFTEERKGDLMSRVTMDVQEVEWSILNTIEAIFKGPIVLIGCLIFMISISIKLTLFVLILILFTAAIIGGLGKSLRSTSSIAQTKLGDLSSILEESLSGIRIIKAYNAEQHSIQKFRKENQDYFTTVNNILYRRDLAAPLSEFLGIGIVSILLWYGTRLVLRSELSPESFFAFVFAFYHVIEPSKNLAQAFYNLQKGRSAMDRINEVLDISISNKNRPHAFVKKKFDDLIEFRNVSFKYDGANDYALRNFNLIIHKGESIALVGSSGAGKSTIADLLIRFQECSEGQIIMDGYDILSLDLEHYRNMYGVVTQEPILFNNSIAENITIGQAYDESKVFHALESAYLRPTVDELQYGIHTNIGDRGQKLSGGQKQRLTIARAIYKNPDILILDEATSSLDGESEKIVQSSIENIMKHQTTIIIAHRMSTIVNASKIVLLHNGGIEDMGTHPELMERSVMYKSLFLSQKP